MPGSEASWRTTPMSARRCLKGPAKIMRSLTRPKRWKFEIEMSVSTTVKTIQDIMRKDAGVDGDAQRINQLVWMFFLKIFDDRESEKELLEEGYRSPMPE